MTRNPKKRSRRRRRSPRENWLIDWLQKAQYSDEAPLHLKYEKRTVHTATKELVGVDIFVQEDNRNPDLLAERLNSAIRNLPLTLQMITNRGVKVYPQGMKETFKTDHWRCRLLTKDGGISNHAVLWMLMRELSQTSIDVIKTENLYLFDGEKGYSLGQGQ